MLCLGQYKAEDFENRQVLRAGEIEAVEKAKEILANGVEVFVQLGQATKQHAAAKKAAAKKTLAPPAAIAALVGGHSTAKAAVEAGVDRKEIVQEAMKDGDVMAWLLAPIPE